MSELTFSIVGARAEHYAAVPTLMLRLRIVETTGQHVHMIALRTQIQIEATRRKYSPAEEPALADLFGAPPRWGETVKTFLWTHVATMVAGFDDSIEIDLPVICTYDMDVASTKYFHALEDGEIPLVLQFSGTLFTRGLAGFSVEQLSWTYETQYRLPLKVWREVMDHYFGGTAWIAMSRDSANALHEFKNRRGFLTWTDVISTLLAASEPGATEPARHNRPADLFGLARPSRPVESV